MADMSPSSLSNTMSTPASVPEARRPLQKQMAESIGEGALPSPILSHHSGPSKKRKISPIKDRTPSLSVDQTSDGDAGSTLNTQPREGKRVRVHFSCVACHRRKTKCDRKEPCSQCVARRVPHLCRPFVNGVEDPNSSDVHARLTNIESLLNTLVSSSAQSGPLRSPHIPTDASSPDVSMLTASGEEIFHPRSELTRQSIPSKPPPSGFFPDKSSHQPARRHGYGWGLKEGRMISLSAEENPDLKEVLQTLQESGISKHHLEWVIAGVPGRRLADGLVELYFRDIDWTRYKTNCPTFMRRYTSFFDSIGRNPNCPKIDAETIKWLPLLFIVLAISTLSAPANLIPADEQLQWSRRFYGSARSGLEYAKALQRDNLDVLFAGLLASRYMLLTRRPAEGSAPLTTAFQLGLYRDGTVLNLTDKKDVEIRRRAWAMLYHLDRTISLLVGRPASISDAHTDTRIPANLDDEDLEGDFDPAGHPLTQPTFYTYVIVRHKLAEIMGRIAFHTFAIQLPDYATVLSLDRELLVWRQDLPAFFSMANPDLSLDAEYPYLAVQRHLLACEWYYTRITLNRPYLLRRKPQDGRYSYSKRAAIESATADLLDRRDFIMEKGNLIVNSGGYRVLNSYMVLGVTIKLDPDSTQADELRHLLNVVSGRAPDKLGRLSEPLVKEELAIVEFLTAKTSAKSTHLGAQAGRNSAHSSKPVADEQTPVDLLLGLAKTRSGRRAAEEEKRQLRLQQYRDTEEQRVAARGSISSPWGYVAPSMPGLSVQQPFGNEGPRRAPRPLQPPPPKRNENLTNWAPDLFNTAIQPSDYTSAAPSTLQTPDDYAAFQQQMSPFQATADLSQSSPGQQMLTQVMDDEQTQQFVNSFTDTFDFPDLGFGGQQTSLQDAQFNPFALAQAVEDGSGSETMTDDEQTRFLNYILTKIANGQPEARGGGALE